MFSVRSASEKPRFLFRPKRMLSPSKRYALKSASRSAGGCVLSGGAAFSGAAQNASPRLLVPARTLLQQQVLQRRGDGALARRGQPRKPQGQALRRREQSLSPY